MGFNLTFSHRHTVCTDQMQPLFIQPSPHILFSGLADINLPSGQPFWASTYNKEYVILFFSVSGLFHSKCSPALAILLQVTKFHSSLWLDKTPLCMYTMFPLSIYCVEGYLGWFHTLLIVNSAVINMGISRYLWCLHFIFFVYTLTRKMTGSYDKSIFSCSRQWLNWLTFHQQWLRAHFLPHPQ